MTNTNTIKPNEFYQEAIKVMKVDEIDHYATDLYLKVNENSNDLVNRFEYKQNVTKFRDEINHELWYEIPFVYINK